MTIRFLTTDVAGRESGVKALVYGPAGAGKTTLIATAPAPFVISAEKGLMSLRNYRIAGAEVHNFNELNEVYAWVSGSAEARQFQTICIDSSSEVAERILEAEKATNKDPRKAYGEMQDKVLMMLRKFRDLPQKHIYFSAKQEAIKDEVSGMQLYGPGMPGRQLGPAMPYLFDEIFHLGIGKTPEGQSYRYLRTQRDNQYDAKDRSGVLDVYEPPDLNHIFNKIINSGAIQ